MNKKQIRGTSGMRERFGLFDAVVHLVLILISVSILYPLLHTIAVSFSDTYNVMANKVLVLPRGFNLESYLYLLRNQKVPRAFLNTVYYTALGVSINLVMTLVMAYPLSKSQLVGRNVILKLIMFTMFFSGGIIPTYLMMNSLGMINTVWAMILPGAVSVYNTIIMRTFFVNSIPPELQEAAQVDGCSNTRLLLQIVLPLSKQILAVMVLFYGVAHWNAFFNALIYLTESKRYPLQLVLRSILIQNTASQDMLGDLDTMGSRVMMAETIKYALIIVSTLPMMILYPFLQRFFEKGVMVGAVKG